jgi:Carboxypeptidase regulatory-like domain
MRWIIRGIMLVALLSIPSAAQAQATLTGTVRDASGAVLPGVTIEAASPALIEKVRTAVSDGTGQYRITDLPPGTYTVTFALTGFTTVRREGLAVSGSGVIPINADLRIGALEETITVSGVAPLVDTQSTRRETVIDADTINALPITRGYSGLLYATPGLTVQPGVNANDLMPSMALFSAHGGNSTEGRVFVDGVSVNGPFGSNSVTQFAFDVANAQEMQVLVSGGLGESETGGPIANIIPRSGGNSFSGSAFYSGTSSRFQNSNIDDELRALGIGAPPTVRKNWDSSFGIGGPIRRDRLWFFSNVRSVGVAQVVSAGIAPNIHAGDPSQWFYEPEPGVETRQAESKFDGSLRLTGQVSPRNRVTFSFQLQDRCLGSSISAGGGGCRERGSDWIGAPANPTSTAPEGGSGYMEDPSALTQATYTSPVSNRILIDAALSRFAYGIIGNGEPPPDSTLGLIGVTERSGIYGRPGISYRAPFGWGLYDTVSWNYRGSLSYVTGAHNAKFGYQGTVMKYDWTSYTNPTLMRYIFNNRAVAHSLFAQDQWTLGRLTLQGALRYDRVHSWMPAEGNGTDETSRFNAAPIRFERTDSVTGYHDLSPRVGLAYDLFGDGRTAVKFNAGRYLAAAVASGIYSSASPALQFVRTIGGGNGRGWTDANGNYEVDCDLLSPAAQDLRAGGGDVCAALTGGNLNFGSVVPNTTIDPELLEGWGVRPYNWRIGASVQHEVAPGISVDLGYNRRWWGNFPVTINELVGQGDYETWTLPLPDHPELPGGGSGTVSFVAITPEAAARGARDFQTMETTFAPARTAYWHGVDANATARLLERLTLQVGTTTGRGVRDTCALWRALPELQGNDRSDACAVTERWLTTFRGLASYRVPLADVLVSTTIRSARTRAGGDVASNGLSLDANYQIPNAVVRQYLGRLPAGALASGTTTVGLLRPGELYPLERLTQLDMRVAKILRFGGTRLDVGMDVYNLLNSNATTSYLQTFLYNNNGSTWLNPTAITAPRLARFNATLTF